MYNMATPYRRDVHALASDQGPPNNPSFLACHAVRCLSIDAEGQKALVAFTLRAVSDSWERVQKRAIPPCASARERAR